MFESANNPHGEARFATREEIRAAGLFGKHGAEFGFCEGRILRHFNRAGMKITGGAGSGKTSQMALPIIMGGGLVVVILDFKNGEITRVIEPHCALMGIPLYTVDPYSVTDFPKLKISLLSNLKASSSRLVPDVQRFWNALLPNASKEPFFEESGRRFGGAITHGDVALNGSTSFQRIAELVAMLRGSFEAWSEWAEMAAPRMIPDFASTFGEIKDMYSGSPKTFDGITAGMRNALAFMGDPNLQETLVDDRAADFSLDVLTQGGPVIVSMIIPEGLVEVLAPMLRNFISSVRTEKQQRPDVEPVLVLMDEASRLGSFEELKQMFSMGRGEGVTPVVFYQDDGQIEHNLGPTGRTSLEANAAISIDLGAGIRDFQTAQNRSLALGFQTIEVDDPLIQSRAESEARAIKRDVFLNGADPLDAATRLSQLRYEAGHRTKMRKALLTPDQLLNMANDQMLVQARLYGVRPFIAEKRPYFLQRRFAGRYFPNPNEERDLNSVRIRTLWGMRRRKIITAPLPAHLSHLPQYAGGARPFRYVEGFCPKPKRK